ncbi:hypothetical protein MY04_0006 [Flammeovirga sp. MY04]|uniref:hypothetical protein n=1 Tax=Flammeovirga sp. MY04 TaxID=1191459 RepID=UPI00080634D9|nr:hypothetical protein [Flammeovirga sp. MY04]ANQ47391.1 hypothetical protein MY04_0006 [Flammeovirga sp. MY04]
MNIKKPFLTLILLFPFFVQAQFSLDQEESSKYIIDQEKVSDHKVQIYNVCYDPSTKPIFPKEKDFKNDQWIYDALHNKEDKKGEFYLLMSRGTAMLSRPVFTKEQLLSVGFQKKCIEGYSVSKTDKLFEAEGSKFNPTYEFIVDVFSADDEVDQPHVKSMISTLGEITWDNKTIKPTETVVKVGFNFDRVMMQKTTYLTRQITFYYKIEENKTLVQYYVLSYVYSLPPSFVGGAKLMINKVNEGVLFGFNASENYQ